ncbi:MAG: hypothetical protein CL536_04575 [Alcaligenaceae bacterium]|nr:hypothetical protein [Alcaligenaceae bacterium]MAO50228.1 hypothetical protein [Pusillimonas sp.]MBC42061.1 hypothetical protein [Pusillimonas sp.]|tara:strand:+ start:6321 stop:7229 length:909 start_codon:yes stop_codon:yes gene_type:complete
MTNATDRRRIVELVNEAVANGARLRSVCTELGIGQNTYRRWSRGGEDQRPHAIRPTPSHALTQKERQAVLDVCHQPQFASLPPAQIVARLLDDEQRYLASESSFYRILHAAGEQRRRGRQAAPRHKGPPRRHRADHPDAVWSWDVTYLPTQVRGQFLYLYLIIDIYSRKIVGHEVFESENMVNSAHVIQRAVLREQCAHRPLVLHGDNGSAMKGSTIHAKLEELGVTPSHSRARVSNDKHQAVHEVPVMLGTTAMLNHVHLKVARRGITPVGKGAHRYTATNCRAHAGSAPALAVDLLARPT